MLFFRRVGHIETTEQKERQAMVKVFFIYYASKKIFFPRELLSALFNIG
jgi:hypothetical protein